MCLLFIFGKGTSSFSQNQLLTPEALWKIDRVSDPKISPNKKMLIYQVRSYQLEQNKGVGVIYGLATRKVIEGGIPVALTSPDFNAYGARFTPDGMRIGFLSSKSGETQVWEMSPDGSNKRQVTNYPGGIQGFVYSPDGKKLMLIMEVKLDQALNEIHADLPYTKAIAAEELGYRHWDHWEDENYSHIFYVKYDSGILIGEPFDIMKDQRFDAPLQPFGGEEQVCWSPDGRYIYYTCKKVSGTQGAYSTNSDIFRYDIPNSLTENMTDGFTGYDTDPQVSPDGKKLFWLSMERPGYESDKNRLMCYDFDKKSKFEITKDIDRTAESFCFDLKVENVYVILTDEGAKRIYKIPLDNFKPELITPSDVDYLSVEYINSDYLLATRQSISEPSEIFLVDKKGGSLPVSRQNAAYWSTIKKGQVEKRWITATDGKKILTWVIYPPDFDKKKQYPALLYCQGGPQSPVSQFFSYRWNFQLMASKGYIVVAPNRRGLQGFGKEWNDQIMGDYGGQCMNDYLSAIDAVADEPFVDTTKLACVGASFGGYSVYWLAGHHQKRFKCFISHCGMFNMESWYGTTEEMFFAKNDQKGSYWDNPQNYSKFSPHKFVKNWDAPILIIHNEKDFRVPIGQGMEAFTAARERNIPARLLYFPDENHWVTKPQNSVLWQREFFGWLDRWLTK